MIAADIPTLEAIATDLKLESVIDQLVRIRHRFEKDTNVLTMAELNAFVQGLQSRFEDDLGRICFGYIPKEKNEYFNDFQFGDDFNRKFKTLMGEVELAGRCYAHGLNTACVFHLMRVMESGVQYFGRRMGVSLVKTHPGRRVHELSWQNILDEINPKLKALPEATALQKRKFEEIVAIKSHLEAVKDAWRNPTMHPRESYDSIQALNIIYHVRSFMNDLAKF